MDLLHEKIISDGKIFAGNILKVDSFLNHQIDVTFMEALGEEIARRFSSDGVTKVLTVEASGIAIAFPVAQSLGCDMIFAKKSQTKNLGSSVYSSPVESFTHGCVYDIRVAKEYLHDDDVVVIVDDFLANGNAVRGLIDIVSQAGATLAGVGIAIEKGFQDGGKKLRDDGIRLESMAIIDEMDAVDGEIVFRD
ncbi:MAG: xanthine phosphoribosyltransferase [Bacillota bacterium]